MGLKWLVPFLTGVCFLLCTPVSLCEEGHDLENVSPEPILQGQSLTATMLMWKSRLAGESVWVQRGWTQQKTGRMMTQESSKMEYRIPPYTHTRGLG